MSDKKKRKLEAKLAKKAAKADLKRATRSTHHTADRNRDAPKDVRSSPAVRFAEYVRGALYVVIGSSLIVALILGQRGKILSLDDIIDSLFAARAGKLILGVIAAALVIYGLRYLRVVR